MPIVLALVHKYVVYGLAIGCAVLLGVVIGLLLSRGGGGRGPTVVNNNGNAGQSGFIFGMIGLAASILSLLANLGGARDFLLTLFGHPTN